MELFRIKKDIPFMSYGRLTTTISLITFIISKVFIGLPLLTSFATVFIALMVLAPLNLRLSRILWINMFVSFEEETTHP